MAHGRRSLLANALALALLCAACSTAPASAPSTGPSAAPVEDPAGFDQPGEEPAQATVRLPETEVVDAPPASEEPAPAPAPQPTASAEPFAVALTWDGIDLALPSSVVELVGFHESNHDGARPVQAYEGTVRVVVMESRERGTGPTSASDIVVAPDTELRAPVTGTVKRAGTYTLYCDNLDDFLVIEPEGRPGIEVKLLHIDGVMVGAGDRVEAGVTPIAPRPTVLPFSSQVDEHSAVAWPHVHLEVVDTAIPDIPNANSGSDDC